MAVEADDEIAVKADNETAVEADNEEEILPTLTGLDYISDWLNNTSNNRYASMAEEDTFSNFTQTSTFSIIFTPTLRTTSSEEDVTQRVLKIDD